MSSEAHINKFKSLDLSKISNDRIIPYFHEHVHAEFGSVSDNQAFIVAIMKTHVVSRFETKSKITMHVGNPDHFENNIFQTFGFCPIRCSFRYERDENFHPTK